MKARSRLRGPWRSLAIALGLVAFVTVVTLCASRTANVLNGHETVEAADSWGMEDYGAAVYFPVRAMLSGVNPYYTTRYLEAFPVRVVFPLYSPGVLLVNLPFGLLPFELSAVVFFTVSVALIPVLAILVLSVAGVAPGLVSTIWLSVFIAAGRPLYANLTLGQTALPVAIGIVLALHFARRRPGWGGVGLAVATLKPTFGVPLALLMAVRGDFKALGYGILGGTALAAIPTCVLLLRAGGLQGFVEGVPDNLAHFGADPTNALHTESWSRIDAAVAATRVLGLDRMEQAGPAIAVTLLVVAGLAVYRASRSERHPGGYTLSSLVISVALLVSLVHQSYDATIAVLPLVVVASARRIPWRDVAWPVRGLLVFLLLGIWFNYLSTALGIRIAGIRPGSELWRWVTSFTSLALLIVFGILVTLAFVPTSGPAAGPGDEQG